MNEIDWSKFIQDGYTPPAISVRENFADANKELLIPFPSTRFKDFPDFDRITGGFRPYEFSILCGSTGSGKTTLIANLSLELLKQGIPHYVEAVETGHTDFTKRLMSALARKDWNQGDSIPVADLQSFSLSHGKVFKSDCLQLALYDNRIAIERLMEDVAYMVRERGVKVCFIDNLNFFMEVTNASDSIVEMDRVIHEMIMFCKKIPVHIVMVMHPKKTLNGRVVSEFDVKGSSTAVQESHNVFLFNRPDPQAVDDGICLPQDREIIIAKMRRKGRFVGSRLYLACQDGVSYQELKVLKLS